MFSDALGARNDARAPFGATGGSAIDHAVTDAGTYADYRLAGADDLVLLLQTEHDAELARRVEDLLADEPALDLALASLVRFAVGLLLGLVAVAHVPFDRRAV